MDSFGLIAAIATSLGVAVVLGFITFRLGLSPIIGYLLAGLVIGPYTPGFVGNTQIAMELAEIGVVLLMFGVGLHFHWKDLLAVKRIAVTGAIGQSVVATLLGLVVAWCFGWSAGAGLVLGMAVSVASTVVLIRVLMDNNVLETPQGHAAVGWLVVEDIFTVIVLVMLPATVLAMEGAQNGVRAVLTALAISLGKMLVLGVLMAVVGSRVIPWLMDRVAKSRSRELFTLTVLAIALGIATGSAWLFGASMALGAFLAGMVVGQSKVGHQAASDVLPMRDAFAVLFFVAVGMLFDPRFLLAQPWLVLAVLGIVLIAKPITALVIVSLLGYPVRTGLTIAIGLSQIGEFSFILSQMGRSLNVLPDIGHNVLVAGALISITLNPLLFAKIGYIEALLQRNPVLWGWLNWRSKKTKTDTSQEADNEKVRAVVIGYGPVGQVLTRILNEFDIKHVIIDLNLETVEALQSRGVVAIYGDASRKDVLEAGNVRRAEYLLVTLPDTAVHAPIVAHAKELNPDIRVLVRARYVSERAVLEKTGVRGAYEEVEIAVALASMLLGEIGLNKSELENEIIRVRFEVQGPALENDKTIQTL